MEGRAKRRLPVGAETTRAGVDFRVWAPRHRNVDVVLEPGGDGAGARPVPLQPERDGYFSAHVADAGAGSRYQYRLDGSRRLYPDPASRFQPDGPHGDSQVVDPAAFRWTDADWRGVPQEGQVIYELHIGTFTRAGTFAAATAELAALKETGITLIELMPVADFTGRFGWGYDGVDLYAPTRLYGEPDDLRRFADTAHALGLGVILDVVYNHLGPDGNYLREYSESYFSTRHRSEWGDAPNFDGPGCGPVREFFVANAGYWIEEYHLDGLRIDATQQIFDDSPEHVLTAIAARVRAAAHGRAVYLVAENEPQDVRILHAPEHGGHGLTAVWNDDFHRSAIAALTGRNEAYFSDYRGGPQEFISLVKRGFLYQGQRYEWQHERRGTPTRGIAPERFIAYLENHDQIANTGRGYRMHMQTSPGRHRALTALLLLAPQTPMLFQGQEFGASTCFFYFADHREELARKVDEGRKKFLAQFRSLGSPEVRDTLPDPADPQTFVRSKLDLTERHTHAEAYALHRDLLRLRREDPVLRRAGAVEVDGAVLGPEAFVLRFFGLEHGDDRLVLVNLGLDLHLRPAPEPLLAPPAGRAWRILWSSEHPCYGGRGMPPLESEQNWWISGHAAVAMRAMPLGEEGLHA
ncbi:MAG TPA: malto-oligosyltrehalose trehalohydrolase [Burkholderiales bacterium]